MVERYSISRLSSVLEERFQIEKDEKYKPRYNAAPTQLLPVITLSGRGGLSYFHWGQTPQLARNKTVSQKLLFTDAGHLMVKSNLKRKLSSHRCIIPADGFFAWKKTGKKELIPYRIVPLDQSVFSVPGLWEEYENEEGDNVHTFSMIQTVAPEVINSITGTFPVILNPKSEEIWLDKKAEPEALISLLTPYSDNELSFFSVSTKIYSLNADGPELTKPAPAADQFGNYSLFD